MQRNWTIRFYFQGTVWEIHPMTRKSALAFAASMTRVGLSPAIVPAGTAA